MFEYKKRNNLLEGKNIALGTVFKPKYPKYAYA